MKTTIQNIAKEKVQVTDFADYRTYLHAIYVQAKAEDSSYSYAKFSTDLELGSSNAHGIISGNRKLTLKAGKKVASILKITGVQRKFFLTLINEQRASSAAEREKLTKEKLLLKKSVLPTELDRRQLSFFEHWYHVAILEILRLSEAKSDPEWIKSRLRLGVSLEQVQESLKLLEELNYISYDEAKGRLYPTEVTISTGREAQGVAVANFHKQMLVLSSEALDNCDYQDRDVSAVTMAASSEMLDELKEDLLVLRKKYLKKSSELEESDLVMQLNMQAFFVSVKKD